jgi:hypothetical protein
MVAASRSSIVRRDGAFFAFRAANSSNSLIVSR